MFEEEKRSIYIGSDHAGYKMKGFLKEHLDAAGYNVTDLGCFSEESCDYPDIAREVAEKVLEVPDSRGILICGTGIGMAMAANKYQGIRAANVNEEEGAELARRHNDANILTMGAREITNEKAARLSDIFLNTKFEGDDSEGERHKRRVEKVNSMGK